MLAKAMALPRRLLHGGAAGDAEAAGGRAILQNVGAQFAARAVTTAISVITVSLTARTLHPTGYGVWNGVSSFVGLFTVLTDLGLTIAAMQRMAAEPEREAEWLGALAGARTALSLAAMAICAAAVPLVLPSSHHSQEVGYILTTTILWGVASALTSVFQSRLRAALVLSFTVLQAFLWLAGVVVLHAHHSSVIAFSVVYVGVMLFIGALQVQTTRRYAHIAWRAGMKLWRPLIRVAVPLGLAGLMISVYYRIDAVLLLGMAGARETGIYAAATNFLGPLGFLPAAVMTSFFPVIAAAYGKDPDRARRLVQIAADVMAVISLPILAGAIALKAPIIHFMYGPGFGRAVGLLPILIGAFVSICFGTLAGHMAPVLNLQWRLALFSTLGAVANIVLNVILIPPYGAYGSAWATLGTELLTMSLMMTTVLRALGLRLSLRKPLRTVLLAAAMTAVMVLARPLGFVPAGLLGVVFFAVGIPAARIVTPGELRMLRA
jgi:O-antigen/teichoic acid export membrane protein